MPLPAKQEPLEKVVPGGQNCPGTVEPELVVQEPLPVFIEVPVGHIIAGRVAELVVHVPFAPGVVPAAQKSPLEVRDPA